MHTPLHPRRRATWRQHFVAVARALDAGAAPMIRGMRPGLKAAQGLAAGRNPARGCAASHS